MKVPVDTNLLTRVEGHGSLELVRQTDRVVDVRFHLHESPRLFEKLLIGKRYDEVADIICRICSICSTVHKVASLSAIEVALQLHISPQTKTMRKLALLGGIIESHALHLVCLAFPDYRGAGGFPGLAVTAANELSHGLQIKAFGNRLQEIIGGRAIHPFNLLPGGLGKAPATGQLRLLAEQARTLDKPVAALAATCEELPESIPRLPALPAAATDTDGTMIYTSLGGRIAAASVIEWLHQEIVSYSNARVSRFEGRAYQVGPLARQRLFGSIAPDSTISASHKARMNEIKQALIETESLLEQLLSDGVNNEEKADIQPRAGNGIALFEAPRGTLVHSYCFDETGICRDATVITPTAINQGAIQESLTALVTAMPDASDVEIRNAAERLVRMFDPCISCAVH